MKPAPAILLKAMSQNGPHARWRAGRQCIPIRIDTEDSAQDVRHRLAGEWLDIGAFELNAHPDITNTGRGPTITIMESTILDRDQTEGIVIGTDNIVLDCSGHKIDGPGIAAGIELKVRKGVVVRNCVVTNFANGFNIEESTLNALVNNTAMNNRNDGFHIVHSAGNILDSNTSANNDDDRSLPPVAIAGILDIESCSLGNSCMRGRPK